jgi:tRNA nucleotidyltransferase (CCA-adding enzyme)
MLMRISKTRKALKSIFRDDPIAIYVVLHDLDLETILYMMAICKDRKGQKAISRYLVEMRNIKPLIKGGDLKKLSITPGPLYSEIFQKVLEEKLKGNLETKKEEIEFIKKHYHVGKTKKTVKKKSTKAKATVTKAKVKAKVKAKSTAKKRIKR